LATDKLIVDIPVINGIRTVPFSLAFDTVYSAKAHVRDHCYRLTGDMYVIESTKRVRVLRASCIDDWKQYRVPARAVDDVFIRRHVLYSRPHEQRPTTCRFV